MNLYKNIILIQKFQLLLSLKLIIYILKLEQLIYEEISQKHNEANAFVSLFFAGSDAIIYLILLYLFGWEFKNYDSPKQKLSFFIIVDAFLRIIKVFTDLYSKSFFKEFLFSSLASIQFYTIIIFINQIFTEKNHEYNLEINSEMGDAKLLTGIFFPLIFSFKAVMSSYKFFSIIQYSLIIVAAFGISKYAQKRMDNFFANILLKNGQFNNLTYTSSFPNYISIYIIINYFMEIIGLLISNSLYAVYIDMICMVFKESAKYLVIIMLIIIYYYFNKYSSYKDLDSKNQPKNEISESTKINIYKDEEEAEEA
jgi:hypothetical protein